MSSTDKSIDIERRFTTGLGWKRWAGGFERDGLGVQDFFLE